VRFFEPYQLAPETFRRVLAALIAVRDAIEHPRQHPPRLPGPKRVRVHIEVQPPAHDPKFGPVVVAKRRAIEGVGVEVLERREKDGAFVRGVLSGHKLRAAVREAKVDQRFRFADSPHFAHEAHQVIHMLDDV